MRTILAMLVALIAFPAVAQEMPRCGTVSEVMDKAIEQYGEKAEALLASGMTGAVMVLFVNRDTGTWTLLTQRGDQLCIVDTGQGFKAVPKGAEA